MGGIRAGLMGHGERSMPGRSGILAELDGCSSHDLDAGTR